MLLLPQLSIIILAPFILQFTMNYFNETSTPSDVKNKSLKHMPLVTARDLFTDFELQRKLTRFYTLGFEFSNDQLIEFEEYDFELIQIRMHTVSEYIFYTKGLSEEEIKSDPLNYPHHCVKIKL